MQSNQNNSISFFKPFFSLEDFKIVKQFIKSYANAEYSYENYRDILKKKLSDYLTLQLSSELVLTKSGTLALYLALLSLPKNEKKEIILPNMVCPGVINAVICAGYLPVIVDVNIDANIDVEKINGALTKKTAAIIAVHYGGYPCDIEKIRIICEESKIVLIEDCAQAIGAKINNRLVGNFGDICILSFYANKIITCGEGGALVFNKANLYENFLKQSKHILTDHFMLDPLLSALCVSQINKINDNINKRKKISQRYNMLFQSSGFATIQNININLHPSYYQYVIDINQNFSHKVNFLIDSARQKKIEIYRENIPNHFLKIYHEYSENIRILDNPVSNYIFNTRILLPCYPNMPLTHARNVYKFIVSLFCI